MQTQHKHSFVCINNTTRTVQCKCIVCHIIDSDSDMTYMMKSNRRIWPGVHFVMSDGRIGGEKVKPLCQNRMLHWGLKTEIYKLNWIQKRHRKKYVTRIWAGNILTSYKGEYSHYLAWELYTDYLAWKCWVTMQHGSLSTTLTKRPDLINMHKNVIYTFNDLNADPLWGVNDGLIFIFIFLGENL